MEAACEDPAWVEAARRGCEAKDHRDLLFTAAGFGVPGSVLRAIGKDASERSLDGAALWAARQGHAEAAIELILMGASLNAKEHDGRTMLHHCAADAKPGHLALLAYLLAEGALPREREKQQGCSPLAWACYSKNPQAVRLLAPHGGLDEFDSQGRTPLGRCATYDGDVECARILLERGADPHAKRSADLPCAFETAILEGSPVAAAMAPRVDFSKRAADGSTWMEFAAKPRGYVTGAFRESLTHKLAEASSAKERLDLDALLAGSEASKPSRNPSL